MNKKAIIVFSVGVFVIGLTTYVVHLFRTKKQNELDEAASAESSENNLENLNQKLKELETKLKSNKTVPAAKKAIEAEIQKVEEVKQVVVNTAQDRLTASKKFKVNDNVMLTKKTTLPIGVLNQNGSFTQLLNIDQKSKQTQTVDANVLLGKINNITAQGGIIVKLINNKFALVSPLIIKKI